MVYAVCLNCNIIIIFFTRLNLGRNKYVLLSCAMNTHYPHIKINVDEMVVLKK